MPLYVSQDFQAEVTNCEKEFALLTPQLLCCEREHGWFAIRQP